MRKPARVPWAMLLALSLPLLAAYLWLLRDAGDFRFVHLAAVPATGVGLALVWWVVFMRAPGRHPTLRHALASEMATIPRGWVTRIARLPDVLRFFVIALTGLALARPQTSHIDDEIELEGIDIVVSLDLSGSMQATDLVPNRLEAAKAVIEQFVSRRQSDRIGLVVFGADAYTYVPLTLDHGTYLRMLRELQLGIINGDGTAIGNGLGVALARLRKSDARTKVVILLTDGENNAGNISPMEAAKMAQTLGVKVYTILAGIHDGEADPQTQAPTERVNPKLLEEIAALTGGSPYLASDREALSRRFESILADLEKSRIRDRGVLYAELYPLFLWPAIALFLLELLLRFGRFRRLP
ncbi:MAG: VWA domain-containing protein [Deltaproteobacteria bacterium]|nr:VWA domain-containing protein [Deltaproteobacteria bacterium]